MKRLLLSGLLVAVSFERMAQQQPANRPTLVAGIPLNYQEDSVLVSGLRRLFLSAKTMARQANKFVG